MQTGDGLLVRLLPIDAIPLAAFAGLCAAARTHGNGIVEVTARGSIQVRGLAPASAPRFAAAVGALGIAANDGVAVYTNPLAGIADSEIVGVAADLRRALARRPFGARLSPKISVVIDNGPLDIRALPADIRLRGNPKRDNDVLQIGVGGDAASAATIGFIAVRDGAKAAVRLLDLLAARGRNARARDVLATEGIGPFKSAVADLLLDHIASPAACRPMAEVIGTHRLPNGSSAYGIGLAFGHADAASLDDLIQAAGRARANAVITAPDRTLIVLGMAPDSVSSFAVEADRLGFITRSDDPRRHVIACAGAPFCASGQIAARTIAPDIASETAPFLGRSFSIHISGCAKGCAHPTAAALTIVGMPGGCGLIANGVAGDPAFAIVGKEKISADIVRHVRQLTDETRHV